MRTTESSLVSFNQSAESCFEPKVRLNIGLRGYLKKPKQAETARIVKELADPQTWSEVSLSELMFRVACEGKPFTPALISTPKNDGALSKCNDCFTSQQVFGLDFDNQDCQKDLLEKIMQRAAELDLRPFGAYFTPSSTPETPKFRLLFCLERPAETVRDRQVVVEMLLDLFPAADQGCKDAARHFNGSASGPIVDPRINPVSTNTIAAIAMAWQAEVAIDAKNCSRKIKAFARKHGLALNENKLMPLIAPLPYIKCEENRDSSIEYIEVAKKSSLSGGTAFTDRNRVAKGGRVKEEKGPALFQYEEALRHPEWQDNPVLSVGPAVSEINTPESIVRWDRLERDFLQCRLVQMLLDEPQTEPPLSHPEFFHLSTHFLHIRGADRVFEQALIRTGHNAERRIRQFRTLSKAYQPQRCGNSGCRFKNSCHFISRPGHKNIFSLKYVRGQVRQLCETVTISLAEARENLADAFDQALTSGQKLCVIRADCGAGKTTIMLQHMVDQANAGKKIIYAAPTHRLLNETYEALRQCNNLEVPLYRWPDLIPHIEDEDAGLVNQIEAYWECGSYDLAAKKIAGWAFAQYFNTDFLANYQAEPNSKLQDIFDYVNAKRHEKDHGPAIWLMTHARLIFSPVAADLAFVDEDPILKQLLTINECSYSDLCQLTDGLRGLVAKENISPKERKLIITGIRSLEALVQTIWATKPGSITDMPQIEVPGAKILRKAISGFRQSEGVGAPEGKWGDLFEFLSGKTIAFFKPSSGAKFVFVSRRDFPPGVKKCIVASASANRYLYEAYAGRDMDFFDGLHIENAGTLVLHPEKSFAGWSLKGPHKAKTFRKIGEILNRHPKMPVICSKALKSGLSEEQQTRVVCTFGATEGLNSIQGQDLLVIGALHRPDYVYRLLGVALGMQIDQLQEDSYDYRRVLRNGFEYFAVAFERKLLQEIQFALLETELDQAIGRARLVSHDCKVHLYNNIPLLQGVLAS